MFYTIQIGLGLNYQSAITFVGSLCNFLKCSSSLHFICILAIVVYDPILSLTEFLGYRVSGFSKYDNNLSHVDGKVEMIGIF